MVVESRRESSGDREDSRQPTPEPGGTAMDSTLARDYTVLRLDEMEAAFGGLFVRVRASLGLSSFGLQVADIPPNSGDGYPEHDHDYDGQEEVYLLLRGSADLHLPGHAVALDPETFVRVGPRTRRRLRSGENGARVLMIGGTPGRAYEPQENTPLGGPETLPCPTASTSLVAGSAPAQLP